MFDGERWCLNVFSGEYLMLNVGVWWDVLVNVDFSRGALQLVFNSV